MAAIILHELYWFLGINLFMGYHKLPPYPDYWKNDFNLHEEAVASTRLKNRFSQILSNIHPNDNSFLPDDNTDKLYKLRPLIKKLNDKYQELYHCTEKLSIDESMILFKGRHSIKQHNPLKPIKRGYKLGVRAGMDGYISNLTYIKGKCMRHSRRIWIRWKTSTKHDWWSRR